MGTVNVGPNLTYPDRHFAPVLPLPKILLQSQSKMTVLTV